MKTDMYEYTCTYTYICLEWIWIYTKDQQRNIWCNTIIMWVWDPMWFGEMV